MADELNPVVESEPVEPAIVEEPEKVGAEPEGNEPEAGSEPQPQEEELDFIEFDGKQYQVPKAIKPGFLMQADYTRKTQEVANQRRELEQGFQRLQQQSKTSQEEMQLRAADLAIDAQLQHYAQVNWDQLWATDPVGAPQQWARYQQLEKTKQQIGQELAGHERTRSQNAQQETVKRFEQTHEYAKTKIPGWTPELDKQIISWAKNQGATDENILSAMSPMVYKMLYLARIGEQTLSKKPAAQTKQPNPTTVIGGKSNPSAGKTIADMDMEEYVAFRTKQNAAKGR